MYYLKSFDENLLKFDMNFDMSGFSISSLEIIGNKNKLPLDLECTELGLATWLKRRSVPKNREFVDKFLSKLGLNQNNTKAIIDISKGLSVNDCYWVAEETFNKSFSKCNLYENKFNNILGLIAFTGYGSSTKSTFISSPEFTTNGMLAKCWRRISGNIFLYKTGTTGAANTGLEPYSEFYASQIAKAMGVDSIEYGLSKWKGKLCSTCKLFTDKTRSYIPMGYLVKSGGFNAVKDYLTSLGENFYQSFLDMLAFDAIIMNTDRHYGNFGLLIDNKTNKPYKFAPIFDNGAGLLPYAMDNDEFFTFDNLITYSKSRTPIMYNDFIQGTKEYFSERQIAKIRKLINFKFKKHSKYNLNTKRLRMLEKLIATRVEDLLK